MVRFGYSTTARLPWFVPFIRNIFFKINHLFGLKKNPGARTVSSRQLVTISIFEHAQKETD
jgi:hypothetical protein